MIANMPNVSRNHCHKTRLKTFGLIKIHHQLKNLNKKRKNLIGQSRLLKERHSKIFPTIFLPKIITRFWYHIPCFQRNVFLPWMENVILWSYNFAKVETSFPSLFKTLPEIAKNTRRSFLKIIRGRNIFQLASWYSAVSSNAGWLHWWNWLNWWNYGQLFAACGLQHYFILLGLGNF